MVGGWGKERPSIALGGMGPEARPSRSTPTSGCGRVRPTSAAQVVQIGTLTANPHLLP